MEGNIKTAVERSIRRAITGIVEEMIEDILTVGYEKQKEWL